jgi:ABC-type lipoprotein release transport system permease subunit
MLLIKIIIIVALVLFIQNAIKLKADCRQYYVVNSRPIDESRVPQWQQATQQLKIKIKTESRHMLLLILLISLVGAFWVTKFSE